jgi:hypothetical protein
MANALEKASNAFNFRDPFVSQCVYVLLFALSLVVSLIMLVFPLRVVVFLSSEALLAALFLKERKDKALEAAGGTPAASGEAIEEKEEPSPAAMVKAALRNLASRVPNAMESEHWYIAKKARFKPKKEAEKARAR